MEDIEWMWHINTKKPINLISTEEVLVERHDQNIARNKINLNYESEKKLFDKYSSIIGIRLTNFNLEWSRIKTLYFQNKKLSVLCYCILFLLKYNLDAFRKIFIGFKRRLKKC